MNDSLKDFIGQNREGFDDKAPSAKVWSNIEPTLPKMKQVSLWNSVIVWRAAALAFLCLSVYILVIRPNPNSSALASQQKDFIDLESFYSNQIAEKVELINDFDSGDGNDQFTQDFQKLDAMYQVLREEMKIRPSDKVKDALVLNLLVRIDLLNQQLKKLEERNRPAQKNITI